MTSSLAGLIFGIGLIVMAIIGHSSNISFTYILIVFGVLELAFVAFARIGLFPGITRTFNTTSSRPVFEIVGVVLVLGVIYWQFFLIS